MERVLANKANYLAGLGHDVRIVTTDQKGRKPYFGLDERIALVDLGINYLDDAGKGLLAKTAAYLGRRRRHRKQLEAYLKQDTPDVTVSMFDHDASFLYRIQDGSRKVLEIHFSRFKRLQYDRKGLWGWVDRYRSEKDRKLALKYDRFVVLTEEDRPNWGPMPHIRVIPNANSFVPSGSSGLTVKSVLAVGRFEAQKGFDELIRAWAMVDRQEPGWTLNLIGEGPLERELKELAGKLNLQHTVTFSAPVSDMEREYLASSVVVMTSRYEGLPMVLLEAQACGLPLVAYRCQCGPADIIEDGYNGFLVDQGDRVRLADRLLQLMRDGGLRRTMAKESLSRAANFESSAVMAQWLELFESLKKREK